MTDYLINFVTNLDPNVVNNATTQLLNWPKYTNSTPSLMTFQDAPAAPLAITSDTYRQAQMAFGMQMLLEYPI
jgi:hypothetical protein